MAGMTLTGLATGIDTQALIKSIIDVESIPKLQLQNRVSNIQTELNGLRTLNTRFAELVTFTEKAAKPAALSLFSATASNDGVTATAGEGASAGTVDVVVDKLAQAQSSVTATSTTWTHGTALTITGADGTATEITAASTSLDDIVTAVNDSGAGVTAMKVASGTNAAGETQYRVQFTAKDTGAAGAFTVHAGTAADIAAGTATDVFAEAGAAHIRTAQDAEVRLWAGTAAEQTITSASNTFTGLLPGVDVTVAKVSAEPVTVTVTSDQDARSKVADDLVKQLNGIFGYIDTNTKAVSKTDANGGAYMQGGVFSGESVVRSARNSLLAAATYPVNGRSPSEIGISVTKEGVVEYDAEKFKAAMDADPTYVTEVFTALSARIGETAKDVSDQYDGSLTNTIKYREGESRDISDQIASWDRRLSLRQATLSKQWAVLEVTLGKLQSQQEWLTGQLASLPSYNKKD